MSIKTGRAANSSTCKMFMPMKENGADVNPLDAIGGITYPSSVTSAGDGSSITFGADVAATITGGTFPVIGANDSFIIMYEASVMNTTASGIEYGDVAVDSSVSLSTSFSSETMTLKIADAAPGAHTFIITSADITDYTAPQGFAFAVDRTKHTAEFLVNGVTSSDVTDISAASGVALLQSNQKMRIRGLKCHGLIVFVFENQGLPSDYKAALASMGASFAINDMRIWAAWEYL